MPAAFGASGIIAHPTWGEVDGLMPAVALWVNDWDQSLDLCPAHARELAAQLIRAAEAAEETLASLV
ncbi:MAG: hypothetical protein QM747_18325 [Nocardioides sp.]